MMTRRESLQHQSERLDACVKQLREIWGAVEESAIKGVKLIDPERPGRPSAWTHYISGIQGNMKVAETVFRETFNESIDLWADYPSPEGYLPRAKEMQDDATRHEYIVLGNRVLSAINKINSLKIRIDGQVRELTRAIREIGNHPGAS